MSRPPQPRTWFVTAAALGLAAVLAPRVPAAKPGMEDAERAVWRAFIAPPTRPPEAGSPLRETVQQLRAATAAARREPRAEASSASETPEASEEPAARSEAPEQRQTSEGEKARSLSAEDLRGLDLSRLEAPMQWADALFRRGRRKAAAVLYERLVEGEARELSARNEAWALYQLANCRAGPKPARALELYRRVSSEFSETPWAAAASAQAATIEWRRARDPDKRIREARRAVRRARRQLEAEAP